MATSKTISVTGQTVSIPAMGDQPDMSVASNAIDKTIDAVNKSAYAVSTNIATQAAFDSLLDSAINGTSATNIELRLRITPSASFGLFVSGELYFVDLKKSSSSTYSTAIITRVGSQDIIKARRNSNGWSYESAAMKSYVDVVGGVGQFRALSSNTDLNTCTDLGFYGCGTGAIAETLSNCPTTSNFAMMTLPKQASLQMQIIFSGANIFTRDRSSGGWGAWKKVTLSNA